MTAVGIVQRIIVDTQVAKVYMDVFPDPASNYASLPLTVGGNPYPFYASAYSAIWASLINKTRMQIAGDDPHAGDPQNFKGTIEAFGYPA